MTIKSKICSGKLCKGKKKPISLFGKDSKSKDGSRSHCKDCEKEYKKYHHQKYPWKKIFNNIKQRCENPKSDSYKNYGLKGIKCNITENELKILWYRDKAYDMKKPSIERKRSDLHYDLDNCEFIELRDNVIKGNKESHIKPILQYSLDNIFIIEFESIIKASKILNIDPSGIVKCARGKSKTCGGYKWKYKEQK